jgi:S1-C subfamily serine protease
MMRVLTVLALFVVLPFGWPGTVAAQLSPDKVQMAREAVARVELGGVLGEASAFAIDRGGRYVTTAEAVLTTAGAPDQVQLTVDLGPAAGERNPMAVVRRVDQGLGLAWLQLRSLEKQSLFVPPREPAMLELGSDAGLAAGTRVTIAGHISGRADKDGFLVRDGSVVAVEREGGRAVRIGIDVPFKPGLAGGPVFDREGKVVGVIAGPRQGSDSIMAIPVGQVSTLLSVPLVRYSRSFRGQLDPSRLREPQEFSFFVDIPRVPDPGPVDVEVVMESGPGDRRVYPAAASKFHDYDPDGLDGSLYAATVVPAPVANRSLFVTVEYKSGAIQGRVTDREFRAGDRTLRLSDLDRAYLEPVNPAQLNQAIRVELPMGELKPSPVLKLKNQRVLQAMISGLAPLSLDVEGQFIPIYLDRARTLDVFTGKEPPAPAKVGCTVVARQGKHELGRRSLALALPRNDGVFNANRFSPFAAHSTIDSRGLKLDPLAPISVGARGIAASIKPPPIPPSGRKDVPVEGIIADVVVGGGGRYLLLVLGESRRLAVFDVDVARVIGHIPLPSRDALVAAGAQAAFLFDPGSKILETWDLKTRTRTGSRPFLTNCRVSNITMGSDSIGPLLVYWQDGQPQGKRKGIPNRKMQERLEAGYFTLIDPASFRAARFIQPNLGADVDGRPGSPEPGDARILPPAASIRFIPRLGPRWDGDVFPPANYLQIRASADGRAFGIWAEHDLERVALVLDKSALQCFDMSELPGSGRVIPGPDGATIFCTDGVFDVQGRRRADGRLKIFLPSSDPASFFAIRGFHLPPSYRMDGPRPKPGRRSCDIYLAGDPRPVVTFDDLDEMDEPLAWNEMSEPTPRSKEPWKLTMDKRFHYIPAARLLITIPATGDCLVLRRVDPLDRPRRITPVP